MIYSIVILAASLLSADAAPSYTKQVESAAQAAVAVARPLAHNEYKVALVTKLVRAALTELAQ